MALQFIDSGDFLWNAGIFVWKAENIILSLRKHLRDLYDIFEAGNEYYNTEDERAFIERIFAGCKNISIDYGIMEKSENVYVYPADFGWTDLGTWGSLHNHLDKDEHNNGIIVKNEKEFKAKMKEEIEKSFVSESDNKLKNDVILHLIEKTKIELPDTFLKKWLVQTNEKGLTTEQVEEEYDQYSKSLKWQLIENKIIKDNELEVKHEDVIAHTKEMITQNFAQYGQPAPDDKKLDEIAAQVLTNEEERKKVYNQLYDVKTLTLYKEKFMLKDKTVTYDEFVKLASQQ